MGSKNSLLEQVDINELLEEYKDNTKWLLNNNKSSLKEWDIVCNRRAILTVKIYTYYSKNNHEKRED